MTWNSEETFAPKLVFELRNYSLQKFFSDLIAGITVGLVALPLAMAFAISSGVPPQSGIYTAIFAGFLISALGGSRTQIGGPTGAFVVVVSGIVQQHGIDGLYTCTLIAGVLLMIMGITRLGTAVKYIPRPVVIGFTNGIAVLIASTQIKDFFGLKIDKVPGEFIARMQAIVTNFHTIAVPAAGLAIGTLAMMILVMRFLPKLPGAIAALFVGTAIAVIFKLPVETIGSKFGGIPSGLPHFHMPAFRLDLVMALLSPALTVTMLGAIESLLSAVVSDRMSGDRHNPNVELFAQGVANFVSPLFGGIPATGAIARTATNVRSGAKSPMAGMIHALTLFAILMGGTALAARVPLAVLAAILFIVAYNMGEWREIPEILRQTKADVAVWLITFLLTVLADLTVAVEAGMMLAALMYIRRVTTSTVVQLVTDEYVQRGKEHSLQLHEVPAGVAVFRIQGPFLFGASDKLSVITDQMDSLPPIVVLRLRNMTALDATGLHAIADLAKRLRESGREIVMCGAKQQPAALLEQAEFARFIGRDNMVPSVAAAIVRSKQLLAEREKIEAEPA